MARFLVAIFLVLTSGTAALADCVILLHGLARTRASFAVMESALEARGYQVVRPGYASTEAPVETLATQAIPRALDQCGAQDVHFVTHSMGGILLRLWQRDHPVAGLGHTIMLGPPNQGAELVNALDDLALFRALNGPAGVQMAEGGVADTLPPADYPVGVIAGDRSLNPFFSVLIKGPDDGKVAVSSTRIGGMRDHLVLPVTHTFMMNNPLVIVQTLRFLQDGKFDDALDYATAFAELSQLTPDGSKDD